MQEACVFVFELFFRHSKIDQFIDSFFYPFVILQKFAGFDHRQQIDAAIDAKADAVKFQTFTTKDLVVESAKKAEYQSKLTGKEESQFEMLKRLELTEDEFRGLNRYCKDKGIEFL